MPGVSFLPTTGYASDDELSFAQDGAKGGVQSTPASSSNSKPADDMRMAADDGIPPKFQGTLWKKSPNALRIWSFQKRHVELSLGCLTWSAEEGKPIKGRLDFNKNECEVSEKVGSTTEFEVRPRGGVWTDGDFTGVDSGRSFLFDSQDSGYDRRRWIEVFTLHVSYGIYQAKPVHIVCIGNPGSGKSTLLNSLIDKYIFESGVSIGKGLTTERRTYMENDKIFVDTPGLADVAHRKLAAAEISKALNDAARCKLLFVVTLEGGNLRPEDRATMQIVIESLLDAGISSNELDFAVVINKFQCHERNVFQEEDLQIDCVVTDLGGPEEMLKEATTTVSFDSRLIRIAADARLEDKVDFLDLTSEHKNRIDAVRDMKIVGRRVVVKHNNFEERTKNYRAQIDNLEKQLKKQKKQEKLFNRFLQAQEENSEDLKSSEHGAAQNTDTPKIQSFPNQTHTSNQTRTSNQGKPLMPKQRTHLMLFIGNKGVGTTTLKDYIEGQMKSTLGDTHEFLELEGLADPKQRVKTSNLLTQSFKKKSLSYKVFFVIVLNSGRLRAEDQETVKLLRDAVPGLRLHLNVIINKMSDALLSHFNYYENMHLLEEELFHPAKIIFIKNCASGELEIPLDFMNDIGSANIDTKDVGLIDAQTPDSLRKVKDDLEAEAWELKAKELSKRGMSLKSLLEFYEELPKIMPWFDIHKSTTSDVVRQAIIPHSWNGDPDVDGQALASFTEKGPVLATRLVSHTWSNPFAYTLAAMLAEAFDEPYYEPLIESLQDLGTLRTSLEKNGKLSMRFWFCAVSVNQHNNICGGFGQTPLEKCKDTVTRKVYRICECRTKKHFNEAGAMCEINKFDDMLHIMRHFPPNFRLVVAVDPGFVLFSRVWCLAELVECGKSKIGITLKMPSNECRMQNLNKLEHIKIQECQASRPEDVNYVLDKLRKHPGDESEFEKFNTSLKDLIWNPLKGLLEGFANDVKEKGLQHAEYTEAEEELFKKMRMELKETDHEDLFFSAPQEGDSDDDDFLWGDNLRRFEEERKANEMKRRYTKAASGWIRLKHGHVY